MSDDDDDYMSSAFLDIREDVRPGLVHSRQVKRKHEIERKRLESNRLHRTKSRRALEEESRTAGLESALPADNKGYAMLLRMGYQPGAGLGRGAGLSEPIQIKIKTNRGGLGREEEIRQRISERRSRMRVYREEERERLTEEFRERMRNRTFNRHLMSDLRRSQKVCQQLDAENGVDEPVSAWFWYPGEEEEEDDDEIEPHERLSFVLDYLRTKYLYCLWCGIRYETPDDMDTNCPGAEKSDHDDDL